MHKIKALFTLIRFPNLVFIFLTQLLAWYQLIQPSIVRQTAGSELILSGGWLFVLACSTVLIAAAGYIINDYFDIGIDAVNKPERVTIEKIFKRRSIIVWHVVLNVIALLMAGFIAYHFLLLRVLGFQLLSILLLLVYSTTFKRKLISGNFIISILTALTMLSLAAYEMNFPWFNTSNLFVRLFWLYTAFAFLITFCREVVKDIEDIKGDEVQHCRTIALVWGVQVAKNFVFILCTALIGMIGIAAFNLFQTEPYLVLYWLLFVIMPLLFTMLQLHKATNSIQFHRISSNLKWITLAGILSMLIVSFNY